MSTYHKSPKEKKKGKKYVLEACNPTGKTGHESPKRTLTQAAKEAEMDAKL